MAEKLFCPRCGNQFTGDISYCRTCGLSLDGVSEIVKGEAESEPVVTRRPNFKLFQIGIALFILGLVIGLINGALRDFELFPQSYGKLVFMLLVAAGMLTLGAGFLFPTKKYTKQKPSNRAETDTSSDTAPLAGQLNPAEASIIDLEFRQGGHEAEKVPLGSVTEGTTRDLDRHID